MKGIALIGMLISLLIMAYLILARLNAPAPETALLGKAVPIIDAPAAAKQKLDEAMKMEEEHLKAMEATDP